jgi:hypothetical protein
MLNSIPKLANVLFLLVFLLYIFSIIGITFFMGLQVRALRARSAPAISWSHVRARASGDQSSPSYARRCSTLRPAPFPVPPPPPPFSLSIRSTIAAALRSGRQSGRARF